VHTSGDTLRLCSLLVARRHAITPPPTHTHTRACARTLTRTHAHATRTHPPGIGFCVDTVNLERLPGWEPRSYGYHGDDGHAFHGSGQGRPFGPGFGTGDVVGALLDRGRNTISYYKCALRAACMRALGGVQGWPAARRRLAAARAAAPHRAARVRV
jgi:hypothetical protein